MTKRHARKLFGGRILTRQLDSLCLEWMARANQPELFASPIAFLRFTMASRACRFVTLQIFSPWLVPRQSTLCYDSNSHERSQVVLARHTPVICHSPLGCLLRCNPEQIVQAVVYPRLPVMRRAMRPGRSIFSANYDVLRLFGSPLAKVAFIYLHHTLQHGGELAAVR